MATTTDTDLTAADVAWDLEPLVDGEGEAGVDELLDEADHVAASVAERRGTVAQLDAAGLASVMRELASIAELVGRAGVVRESAVRGRHHRPGARGVAPARRGTGHRHQHEGPVLRARMGGVARRPGGGAPRRRAADVLPPLPRGGAPLPAPPPHRARRARDDREGGHRAQRVEPAVQRADVDDRRRSRRWTGQPRRGAVPAELARPGRASNRGRGGDRRARAGPADAGVRVQHVAGRQGRRRPLAQVPALAREHEPRQRGQRRVGASARRRGAGPVRHPAALVRAQGSGARARPARRLRPHGVGGGRGVRVRMARGARARAGRVRLVLLRAPGRGAPILRRGVDRRPRPTRQAPGRVLRVHGAVAAPVPAAELDRPPPRRA